MQLPSSRSLLSVFVVALSGYGSCAPCASRPAGSHDHGRTCTKWGATAYSFPPTAMLSLRSCSSSGTRSRGDQRRGLHRGCACRSSAGRGVDDDAGATAVKFTTRPPPRAARRAVGVAGVAACPQHQACRCCTRLASCPVAATDEEESP
jgi:hypothetical protein